MNEAAPVRPAAKKNSIARLASPVACAGFAAAGGAAPLTVSIFSNAHTANASATFSYPAAMIVPGRPTTSMSQKPLANTPIAAPMLFVKYNIDKLAPGSLG